MATDELKVEIVSPEGEIYSGKANMLFAKGAEGELGIAPGHLQLLTSISPGAIRLLREEEEEELMYVSGGILYQLKYIKQLLGWHILMRLIAHDQSKNLNVVTTTSSIF